MCLWDLCEDVCVREVYGERGGNLSMSREDCGCGFECVCGGVCGGVQ